MKEYKNNPLAVGHIYKGVVPVRRGRYGTLSVGGEYGDIVDWLVHSNTFKDSALWTNRALNGSLADQEVITFASLVAGMHKTNQTVEGVDSYGFLKGGIGQVLRSMSGLGIDEKRVGHLKERNVDLFDKYAVVLAQRESAGLVRRCHGDMHTANIVTLPDVGPLPFDANEEEPFKRVDVAYELAFILMDLEFLGAEAKADLLFREYVRITGDNTVTRELLSPMMATLAAVRAMVNLRAGRKKKGLEYFAFAENLVS